MSKPRKHMLATRVICGLYAAKHECRRNGYGWTRWSSTTCACRHDFSSFVIRHFPVYFSRSERFGTSFHLSRAVGL